MRWDEMTMNERSGVTRQCRDEPDERDYEATDYYELLTGIKCKMIHMTPRYNATLQSHTTHERGGGDNERRRDIGWVEMG